MNLLPALLLTLTTTTLVLRSGDRITVDAPPQNDNGVMTFRVKGTLYSLPASEIERVVEEAAAAPPVANPPAPAAKTTKLAVSEDHKKRLLEKLEQNHSGTPAPPQQRVTPLPPPPTAEETKLSDQDEWAWRRDARAYQEAVRRAKEELELIETRARELQSRIFQLASLGYKPKDYTYDSSQLVLTLEQIPRAQLEVTRAERALAEFRDEARRRGVMPGWLH
ncbi:MAG TPA: hypothetical protein VKB93_06840 [Thermoanaerobaculia bacterium]|nr:hypothetical protein [Thermoanaerobaculia bacterium]